MDQEPLEAFKEELAKTFFFSILSDLSEIGETLSDFEVKLLIKKALSHSPHLQVEWGEMDRFGNNTLLVKYESNLLVIEVSPLISTIRILWNEYKAREK
ncbi:hypothetical protein NUH30_03805 [Leptospira sp. 85282-16]|uniref:hypothetical protein n=1 Tax=Leptospira sp. 85282-16 TaxID=2971256 RepID=UPI0021BED2A9|nr:hypothetical protein [Leptospira sp. 85282-16]MCT8332788.1 hypothetical protein [Leptospira sp. 85282-16]